MPEGEEKYLVLCVDRDDDLGTKAKVSTPVVGRDAAISAATKLALADPEEADANAIFAAVRKYDDLTRGNTTCEVAVVCGDIDRGFEADRRVGRQVAGVLEGSSYTGVVLVTDGADDEQVIPIIQSLKPIVSVQRIAVKHSQSVDLEALPRARHGVTFRNITLLPFLARVARLPKRPRTRAIPLDRLPDLPISSATRKIAAAFARH